MSLTNSLIKAGALYALGRFASNVKGEDLAAATGISGDDLRRYGMDRADALLGQVGLQRQATVPSGTIQILSGFAAGAIVGAGVTFLFYSEQGKDVRAKVAEFFSGKDESEETVEAAPATPVNGGAKVNA